jgi:hypothetical protein
MELFGKQGEFVRPSAETLAALDDDTRTRFAPVLQAAAALDVAEQQLAAAKQGVTEASAELAEARDHLAKLRPPVSAVDAARAWIKSQQGER